MTPEQIAEIRAAYANGTLDTLDNPVGDLLAHIDTLTAALEAEWYNGNLDEKAYRRLCKIAGNEPYPSAILNGETP